AALREHVRELEERGRGAGARRLELLDGFLAVAQLLELRLDLVVVGDLLLDRVDLALRVLVLAQDGGELVLLDLLDEEADGDRGDDRAEDAEHPELGRIAGAGCAARRLLAIGQQVYADHCRRSLSQRRERPSATTICEAIARAPGSLTNLPSTDRFTIGSKSW